MKLNLYHHIVSALSRTFGRDCELRNFQTDPPLGFIGPLPPEKGKKTETMINEKKNQNMKHSDVVMQKEELGISGEPEGVQAHDSLQQLRMHFFKYSQLRRKQRFEILQ